MKPDKFIISISDEAESDIDDAFIWYEIQKPGLGKEFAKSVDNSFNKIKNAPQRYPAILKNIRKCVINKFPFCVYYIPDFSSYEIKVIAVFHTRRNPSVWAKRR